MFADLLSLIIILSLTHQLGVAAAAAPPAASLGAVAAAALTAALYGCLCGMLALQRRLFSLSRQRAGKLLTLEFILFLLLAHHLGGWPAPWRHLPFFPTVSAAATLVLYFGAMFVLEASYERAPWQTAMLRARFLLPFAVPYLLYTAVKALYELSALPVTSLYHLWSPIAIGAAAALFFAILLCVPPLFTAMWGCRPLPPSPLRDALVALCRRCSFHYRQLCSWPVMRHSYSAAIMGMIGPLRYVLFSERLLRVLPERCVVAVLCHEIGHSAHRHLLKYPYVILGLLVIVWQFETWTEGRLPLADDPWKLPLLFAGASALLLGYFRYVFGFFSRLFERQADLYVFDGGVPPQDLIDALDRVAFYEGTPHDQPDWHHYSIGQRIAFLRRCQADPGVVAAHHRRVQWALACYSAFLLVALLCCFAL